MDKTSLGDRMKQYENIETSRKFMPLLPVYARIDGRSFSKFTQDMDRPYDERMSICMMETTKYLVEQTNALIGFVQSDEISLAWYSDSIDSQIFFDGKIQKMVSVLAGMASSMFYMQYLSMFSKNIGDYYFNGRKLPSFDARVFQLPNKIEVANTFLWREKDATKNAISMAARAHFSHKNLHGKSGAEMQEMMWKIGTNFNDYPDYFKRGTFIKRKLVDVEITDEEYENIPEAHRPDSRIVQRHRMISIDMPPFGSVTNRVGVIFDGEDPKVTDI